MTRNPLSLAATLAAAVFFPAIIQAQIPSGSSAREIPNEVQKTDGRVDQVIERANDHFRKGKLNLEDDKREQARDEFDKAVDEILMSGLDVRANQRLQTYYLELVEKIYREEVPLIQQFINYYQGRGRSTMVVGLRRSGRYMKIAREAFRRMGVPEDLTWLGQVESAWQPRVVSYAAASGLWQFVRSTGAQYGMRQTAWVDERNGIEKPTYASAQYLKDLAKRYNGDWLLAMAAYNTGALNVDRAISRAGAANYWKIYPYISQQTQNYVPNILAVILIAKNPEKYGFHGIRPEAPLSFESVGVPSATSLRLIADATDTSVEYLQSLNPELKRDTTPRGESYTVRVPPGKGKQLAALLKRVPVDHRDSARVISVVPGEDLQSVANRTGVSVATLQAMNPGVDLKSTNKLVVPNNNVRLTNWRRATPKTADANANSGLTTVRARKGDTIAKIAAAHKLSADDLARLNGIAPNVELQAGQEIKLPSAGAGNAQASKSRRR